MTIAEEFYYTLLGQLLPEYQIPGVKNIFVPGGEYHENYSQVLLAYERLLLRLNEECDDDDVEIIIDSLLRNEKIIALKMFEYGQTTAHP